MTTRVVASFNVRNSLGRDGVNSWPFRRRRCLKTIVDLQADIVALQEVRRNQFRYFRRRLPDFHVVGIGRDNGRRRGEHMVLVIRRSITAEVRAEGRWFTPTPDVPGRHEQSAYNRFALVAIVEGVTYIATHLDEKSRDARADAIARIASWCTESAVVLGDFNCDIDDLILGPLWNAGFHDALSHVPARGPGCTTHHSFTGTIDGNRIDHIIVSRRVQVVSSSIVHQAARQLLPSDHWPVVATLEI